MAERPSGTVTFLFTDIEASTRRWEADPDLMRVALAAHDDVLSSAVEGNGGWLFKHTGDGVCAAFSSADGGVAAAIEAQRLLELPVRMGIATGEVEQRGEDYFGPALNRAARVMGVGHGGQVLVSGSAAGLVSGVDFVDLGERRLRDLSAPEHLFQVQAEGLAAEFPPLATLEVTPGNLPVLATSFVGRDVEVRELSELVRVHRLVTLTGVGGVGKTRLAVQVAAELSGEFGDGVWLVEFAPVADPAVVPDVVATALGIATRPGMELSASIGEALRGREALVVLDNCEHVVNAAADLVEAILGRTDTVKLVATSREGLGVGAERLWPVPPLGTGGDGAASMAVELFVQRAQAVDPGFGLGDPADLAAVEEICTRLDGIALAIELAAARMVSMSPVEVLDRLGDRFRLLAGSRRGIARHQTLRHAVGWSYDLLNEQESRLLDRCSMFADGFGLHSAAAVCAHESDEYEVLDLLDSLVRKSLVTAERVGSGTRYGMLETIRQFGADKLGESGDLNEIKDRHARYFAEQAQEYWDTWDGPDQLTALDWVDAEHANLRAAFIWAADSTDLVTATAIAAHTFMLEWTLERYGAVSWVEEILDAATAADVAQLPRLLVAAAGSAFLGNPDAAIDRAQAAAALATDPRYVPFEAGWSTIFEANAHGYANRLERYADICEELVAHGSGLARVMGLCLTVTISPMAGRGQRAMELADECLTEARSYGNPFWITYALNSYGRAHESADPNKALHALREALEHARAHRNVFVGTLITRNAARVESNHGDDFRAFELFEESIEALQRAGNMGLMAWTYADLTRFLERIGQVELAAIIYGTTAQVAQRPRTRQRLTDQLDAARFEELATQGASMDQADAADFTRRQIRELLTAL